MRIILIGFMGAGKSTVAEVLSARLALPVYETDEIVLARSKCLSISDIFNTKGEDYFRSLETEVLDELYGKDNLIISPGGGILEREINRKILRGGEGSVVYLKAEFETLKQRIPNRESRPLFQDEVKAKELYDQRLIEYERQADFIIETDQKSLAEVGEIILQYLMRRGVL